MTARQSRTEGIDISDVIRRPPMHPAREDGFEARAALGESSAERLVDLDQDLPGSHDVSDPAKPPPGLVIESTDLLNLLRRPALGDLEGGPRVPSEPAQLRFFLRCRALNNPLVQLELGLCKEEVEGIWTIRVLQADFRRNVCAATGPDPEATDHAERPSDPPVEVVHRVDWTRVRANDLIQ